VARRQHFQALAAVDLALEGAGDDDVGGLHGGVDVGALRHLVKNSPSD
jgi:hypothetical protein